MKSVIFGGTTSDPSVSATNYGALCSQDGAFDATEANHYSVISSAGTLSNFRVDIGQAPGVGKSWTYKVRVNGADSGISVAISGTSTSGSDDVNTAAVSAGDLVNISVTPSGTPASSLRVYSGCAFTGTTANESLILGGRDTSTLQTSGTQYIWAQGVSQDSLNTSEPLGRQIIPTAGTIKNLYVKLGGTPGSGNDYTFTLYQNGSPTAMTCTIADSATAAHDTTNTVTVAAGDSISLQYIGTSTPTAQVEAHGFTFVADTDGQFVVMGGGDNVPSNTATNYAFIGLSGQSWDATENLEQDGSLDCTLSNLYVEMTSAPGIGKSWTLDTRVNSASPVGDLSVTVSDAAMSGNDTIHSVSVTAGNLLSMRSVPSGTPTSTVIRWGMMGVISSPAPNGDGFLAFM